VCQTVAFDGGSRSGKPGGPLGSARRAGQCRLGYKKDPPAGGGLPKDEGLQALGGDEQMFDEAMTVGQNHHGASCMAGDPRRDVHEGLAETFPLPAGGLLGQSQPREPGTQIPGQLSGHQKGAVGQEFAGGHAQGGDAVLELFDDILLIASPVGETEDLGGVPIGWRDVGDDEAVAVFSEEIVLPLVDVGLGRLGGVGSMTRPTTLALELREAAAAARTELMCPPRGAAPALESVKPRRQMGSFCEYAFFA
jgi:hypothetical protein